MPNTNIDWAQAPIDADAWEVDGEASFPIWLGHCTLDVTTIMDPLPRTTSGLVVVGPEPAPAFGWTSGWVGSFTLRPLDA